MSEARRCFEDAVDLYARARNPFETARLRLDVAGALAALGRPADARVEAERAVGSLRALGARAAQQRGERLLASLAPAGAAGLRAGPLSPRQLDVLRLIARGLSNREIGEKLFVSEFTVKRHVADILSKLDLPSRAAAAAYAAERQLT